MRSDGLKAMKITFLYWDDEELTWIERDLADVFPLVPKIEPILADNGVLLFENEDDYESMMEWAIKLMGDALYERNYFLTWKKGGTVTNPIATATVAGENGIFPVYYQIILKRV